MSQQAAAAVTPHWIADLVVGAAGALSAVAVAQAAIAPARDAPLLRGMQQVNAAPVVDAPDFVYGEPVEGYEVVSPFGLRQLPWEKAARLHAGVDIAAPFGYPVQAAADGVVSRAGYDGGYGRFVEVRHAQGLSTVYAHLGAIEAGVAPGAVVRIGQRLGRVGSSGSSTGAHLHFEVRDRKHRPMNPEAFIDQAFATAADLPLKSAARVPRGVRIAYVSYIPKKKRELMEREAAEARAAEEATKLAALGGTAKGPGARVVTLTPVEEDAARIANWKADKWTVKPETSAWGAGGGAASGWGASSEPGWSGSSGGSDWGG
ncbi:MAG TPA: M23 family metallopeptidase [Caulobacteraceae bacterium]